MDAQLFLTTIAFVAPVGSTASKASGTFTVVDYTNPGLSGITLTIDNGGITEGLDWNAATSNAATATSIKSAIDGLGISTVTSSRSNNVVTVTAASAGTAGNSIVFSGGDGVGLVANPQSGTLAGGSN